MLRYHEDSGVLALLHRLLQRGVLTVHEGASGGGKATEVLLCFGP